MDRLTGQVAFVTGGASGIGAATARRLAAEGALVIVADLDLAGAQVTAKAIDGLAVALDVTDPSSVERAVATAEQEAGPIGVLVNNAGGDRIAMFVDTTPEDWTRTIGLNLLGAMACTAAVLPGMVERRTGAMVNVASAAGEVGTVAGAAYAAAKAGVLGFTKAIAREAAPHGVRANAVAPGPIETPLLEGAASDAGRFGERIKAGMVAATVLARTGTPEEVAAAIAYLASDDASFVTGHTLSVSGGLVMH